MTPAGTSAKTVPVVAWLIAAALLVGSATNGVGAAGGVEPKPSDGCGTAKRARGEKQVETTSGRVSRSYFRYLPRAYNGTTPLPVVLDLHGHSEPAATHKALTGLGRFGNKHGFITVTPQGSGPPARWDTESDSADMRFLVVVLDHLERTLCIDERRVFVTGYSNGAFMASAMACLLSDRIAAVAPVAGIRAVPGCDPTRPVPVVAFHGVADEWVAFDGGLGPGVYGLGGASTQELIDVAAPTESGLSVPGVATAWAARNGCGPQVVEETVASDVELLRYECPDHADVQLYEVVGGGHTWPGSDLSKALEPFVGPTTFSIDANTLMWEFFRRHPLRGASPTKGDRT